VCVHQKALTLQTNGCGEKKQIRNIRICSGRRRIELLGVMGKKLARVNHLRRRRRPRCSANYFHAIGFIVSQKRSPLNAIPFYFAFFARALFGLNESETSVLS
jgi:hypothetical protein